MQPKGGQRMISDPHGEPSNCKSGGRSAGGAGISSPKRCPVKTHIYYGKIGLNDGDDLKTAVCEDAAPCPKHTDDQASADTSAEASSARHQQVTEAFRQRLMVQSFKTSVPTLDYDVRITLRCMGEPITLFGEGPFERRARLKALVASGRELPSLPVKQVQQLSKQRTLQQPQQLQQQVQKKADADESDDQPDGTFYTEGTPELVVLRKRIASFSATAAITRLQQERIYRQHVHQLQQNKRLNAVPFNSPVLDLFYFNKFLQASCSLASSVVGDERPLTTCRFSRPSAAATQFVQQNVGGCGIADEQDSQCGEGASTTEATLLATASWGDVIKIWRPTDGRLLLQLRGHSTRVHALQWSHSADTPLILASGGADSKICLWDLARAEPDPKFLSSGSDKSLITTLDGHEDRVNRLSFHPGGLFLASTSHDETWRLWDITTQKEMLLQEGHSAPVYGIALHPDGSLAMTTDFAGLLKVTDLRVGSSVMNIAAHGNQVTSVSVHPICGNWVVTGGDDNAVKLWDLRKAAKQQPQGQSTGISSSPLLTVAAHNKMVTECAFEPRLGRCLYTASFDGSIKIWSCSDFSLQKSLAAHEGRVMAVDIVDSAACDSVPSSEEPQDIAGDRRGGDLIVSAGFDRTWKLWHCNRIYSRCATEETLRREFAPPKHLVTRA